MSYIGVSWSGVRKPLALIIEPTRDLAEQVYQAIADFTRHVNDPVLQCALAIGGEDSGGKGGSHSSPSASASASSCFAPTAKAVRIEKRLQQQGVDILIGTIGKLTGLVKTKALDLSQIRFFVLDEVNMIPLILFLKELYYIDYKPLFKGSVINHGSGRA